MTGDYNTEPGTLPVRELTHSVLKLRDSREATRSTAVGPEGTFNNFAAIPQESRRIDYILVDATVTVEQYAVLAWHGEGGRPASDHFPVVADLRACKR